MLTNDINDHNLLVTRAESYEEIPEAEKTVTQSVKRSNRHKFNVQCGLHSKKFDKQWHSDCDKCDQCLDFPLSDKLPNGKLPTQRQVLSFLFNSGETTKGTHNTVKRDVASDLILHWVFCNVYTVSLKTVIERLTAIQASYYYFGKVQVHRRKKTYHDKLETFIRECDGLLDIRGDVEQIKRQENIWSVKMSQDDEQFYHGMCKVPPVGYCSNFVDRKWFIQNTRKQKRLSDQHKAKLKSEQYQSSMKETEEVQMEFEDQPCDEEWSGEPLRKKHRYNEDFMESTDDDLPMKYRHLRDGERQVKQEVYLTMNKLKAKYHMSQSQAEGAITETANMIFGRATHGKWKPYEAGKPMDCNTLPEKSNTRQQEAYLEAMTLAAIVEEIMKKDNHCVLTYSNDGSSVVGTGNFVVQSFSINGDHRALPTLSIFSEKKQNLADLQETTLEMLAASVAYKYSKKEIFEKIDFVMTDTTTHNIGFMNIVAKNLDSDHTPSALACQMHPLMMIQGKIKELFQLVHDSFGHSRIKECFLVDVDFRSDSFIYKAIQCLTSFINRDYSTKPWNREKHFNHFISPKVNESVSLKDHRFNRIFECCNSLVHHLDDIKDYLEKFSSIINGITVIDRSFLDMEILKPIFCAVSIIGVHIANPFMGMIMSKDTTYNVLMESYPKLYTELLELQTDPSNLLQVEHQVFQFTSEDLFTQGLPKPCIIQSIQACANDHSKEVLHLLQLLLPMLAKGFSTQRGEMFGFGPSAEKDSKSFMKISSATDDEKIKLEKAPIHNLQEENSVGYINYELAIRGNKNLEATSKKMIIKKSIDLLEDSIVSGTLNVKHYQKPAEMIKEIKLQWNDKVRKQEEDGHTQKEIVNHKTEGTKYEILEFLKQQEIPGPFTKPAEVLTFMEATPDTKQRTYRMRKEIHYARLTCTTMKPSAAVFRLTRNSKALTSQEYADNLTEYIDTARCVKSLTIQDLTNVLHGLSASSHQVNTATSATTLTSDAVNDHLSDISSAADQSYTIEQHIAALWWEDNVCKWHIGVVDKVLEDGSINVSYLVRSDSKGIAWVYPEDSQVFKTVDEQIIQRNLTVNYMCSVRIKCRLGEDLVKELNTHVSTLNINTASI